MQVVAARNITEHNEAQGGLQIREDSRRKKKPNFGATGKEQNISAR